MLPWKLSPRRLRIGPYEIAAFAIIACSATFRLILSANDWPLTESDEGTMGLEAIHIAFRGEHPIFFYGQNYMGVIEAYLGAAFFRLFGVSVFSLRLGMILLFTLFLVAIYSLTSLLYRKKLAIMILLLVSFGNPPIVQSELLAVGGTVEVLLFGTLSLLLASWLAFTAGGEQRHRQGWRRLAAYGCWGLVVGLGLWSHILVAPFVLMGGIILLVFCHKEWRTWAIPCLMLGLIVGGFPLIVYNLTAPLSQNSLAVALSIQNGSDPGAGVIVGQARTVKHFVGTFLYGLPVATGLYPACSLTVLPYYGQIAPQTRSCEIIQGGWSLVYISLIVVSMGMALVPLGKLLNAYWFHREIWSEDQRQLSVLHFARLMLIFSGLLTIVFFLHSTLAAAKPYSVRYLIGLMIVLPAVLWPLWNNIERPSLGANLTVLWTIFRYSLLVFVVIIIVGPTVAVIPEIPSAQAYSAQDQKLVHDLEQRGITRFYTEYWTCDRLAFLSQEKLICSDVNTDLKLSLVNRISSYTSFVARYPRAPYVVPVGAYTKALDNNPEIILYYHRVMLDGYAIYEPDP
jgi:4-amino-4-deoxy-L-arabinose transferase-like glycosyltransferase